MIAGQFLSANLTPEDSAGTMGTAAPVGATGARCPSCHRPDLVDAVDAIGRVRLACTACDWQETVVRRPPPSEPAPLPYAPGALAPLMRAEAAASAKRVGTLLRSRTRRSAEELADLLPTDWTQQATVARELGMPSGTLTHRLGRVLALGLAERRVERRPYGRGTRAVVFVRRVTP